MKSGRPATAADTTKGFAPSTWRADRQRRSGFAPAALADRPGDMELTLRARQAQPGFAPAALTAGPARTAELTLRGTRRSGVQAPRRKCLETQVSRRPTGGSLRCSEGQTSRRQAQRGSHRAASQGEPMTRNGGQTVARALCRLFTGSVERGRTRGCESSRRSGPSQEGKWCGVPATACRLILPDQLTGTGSLTSARLRSLWGDSLRRQNVNCGRWFQRGCTSCATARRPPRRPPPSPARPD